MTMTLALIDKRHRVLKLLAWNGEKEPRHLDVPYLPSVCWPPEDGDRDVFSTFTMPQAKRVGVVHAEGHGYVTAYLFEEPLPDR